MEHTTKIWLQKNEIFHLVQLLQEELTSKDELVSAELIRTVTNNKYRDTILLLQMKDKKVKYVIRNN